MRNQCGKSRRPTSLAEAFDLDEANALKAYRRPRKQMEELMGTNRSTYARWVSDCEMPAGRLLQFSVLCGSANVIEYLAIACGKLVVSIPTGKKAKASDLGEMQANFGKAVMLLEQFYRGQSDLSETLGVLNEVLSQVAYHRENVIKTGQPELELFEE
ncbi:hypothetical protein [Aquitalea pelogenes]|uniref:hypothetical protein n=1 Tax=Aquitalea pelogenes TaxID=1293573 RepID=UPI0035AFCA1B